MALEIIFAVVGIGVAGLAAIVGIWMERDPRRPPRWAWAISILILMATGVTVFQSYLEVQQGEKMEEDMARMLQQLDRLAASSEDPNLQAFVTSELNAQARANPDIVEKLADRVEEDGGDAADMLSKHMSASEVANLAKEGKVKKKKSSAKPKPEPKPEKKTVTSTGGRGSAAAKPAGTAAPAESPRGATVAAPEGGGRGGGRGEEAEPAEAPAAEAPVSPRGAKKAGDAAESPRGGTAPRGATTDSKAAPSKASKSGPSKSGPSKKSKTSSKKSKTKKPR